MKIGIAGPMNLEMLRVNLPKNIQLPTGYPFPMTSMLINALLKRGHSVVAHTTSIGIDEPIVYEGRNLTVCIGRRRIRHAARDLFKFERRDLVELMLSHPVDIINAQWSYEFAWAALDTELPTIVTLHDHALTILRYRTDPYRFMRLIMNYIVLRKARYLSTNSKYLYNCLNSRNKKKTRIIPNFFSKNLEETASVQVEKSNFVLSVSNGFGRRKNIETALQAFPIIRKSHPNIEYHLIGDGMEMGGQAYKYAKQNNITEGVRFIGKVSYAETIEKMKKALIFLHPSKEESFGMVVLEAMVMGTPVIGGRNSGNIPYLLDYGHAGLLCNINSSQDIAISVLKLLENYDLSEHLSQEAQKFAKANFSEDIIANKYIDYLQHVLDN
jgi:L-malate glycosyltransferase